ncbi:AAA family ATPase [Paenibacillus aquistagni]|uniref:AAA family ATPase n=1 Tax=Paenibacillus aquistagni TaxID=1852522 RepID=UPI00145A4A2E|nr:AAA family ATPase [Paenibacillus aquistagni]NMM53419.1 AAA domain-containing protein [Paenibacillus aquistagni]
MPANRQGEFTLVHHHFFGSVEGGFTAITSREIDQVTFNVKASIRNVLINRIGQENIARTGNGIDPLMKFHIWPGTKETTEKGDFSFSCKFAKPHGNEMTAYFTKVIPRDRLEDGDIWFVFFREGDSTPWFGFMKEAVWDHFFESGDLEVDEGSSKSDGVSGNTIETLTVEGASNLILYGAPGTGKSFELERRASGNITRVTFHSEYTYHDFIGSYKPVPIYSDKSDNSFVTADGNIVKIGQPYIDYQFVPGPFAFALKEALINTNEMHTLKIEELNRANAAAVFGDIFQLLDRKSNGESEYRITPSKELHNYLKKYIPTLGSEIFIPSNLNIYATMNSADQGVFVMDSAFKRRWHFEYMPICMNGVDHENELVKYDGKQISWRVIVESINNHLAELKINEDRHIGPYFMKKGELSDQDKISSKLLVYLWDDVVRHCRNRFFVEEIKTFAQLVRYYKDNKKIFVFNIESHEMENLENDTIDEKVEHSTINEYAINSSVNVSD